MNTKKTKSVRVLSIAFLALTASLTSVVAQPGNILPKKTIPLTAIELRHIYADKTWKWDAGGARFLAKDRKFIAYSEANGVPTVAEGRWEVSDMGRLCMIAVWTTKDGNAPSKKSCFQLVRDRGTIYQRRDPGGSWFVLRTFKTQPTDEEHKLVSEDTVTPNIERLKAAMK